MPPPRAVATMAGMQPPEALRLLGASGFAVSRTGIKLGAHDDVAATTTAAVAAGLTWAVVDGGAAGTGWAWLSAVDHRLATVVVLDAERSDVLRGGVAAAADALGKRPDGLLLRDGGRLAQERAWPTIAELVEEGQVRAAGLVTTRAAVLERCAAWRPADAVLVPWTGVVGGDPAVAALVEACRWSGVTVIRDGERAGEVVVEAAPAAISPTSGM